MTFEELTVRYGMTLDGHNLVLCWPCHKNFMKFICRKIRIRSKHVIGGYIDKEGKVILRLHDSHHRTPEIMAKAVLYEVHRVVQDRPAAVMQPGRKAKFKCRKKAKYTNRPRRCKPGFRPA